MEWLILSVVTIAIAMWAWKQDPKQTNLCHAPQCTRPCDGCFCSHECEVYLRSHGWDADDMKKRKLFRHNKDKLGF